MDIKSLIQSSDSWENYLKFAANMYSYNFSDQIVIYSNFPSATSIASVKQWNAMGRRIIGGEKGTRISGNSVVFDISQTYGREISKWKFTNDYVPFFYDLLNRTNTSDNLIDEESNFSLNVYDFIYTSIGSNKSISGRLNDELREFTALSATYITLTRTNMLDNSIIEYDFSDIATYDNDTAELIGTVAVLYSNALLRCAKQTVKTTTPEQIQARKINAENKVEPIIIEDFEDVQTENNLGNLEDFEDVTTEVPDEIKNEESRYKTPESQLSETDTTDNSDFNESEKTSEAVISINPVTENYSTSLSEYEQMRILDDALMLDNGSIDKAAIKRFYDNNNRRDVVVSYIKHAYHNKALKADNTDYPCVSGYVGKKDGFLIKYSFSTEKSERFSMDWLTTARHIRKLISDNKFVSEQSERKEKSFSQQVDDVLAGKADRYNDIKVCDTPQILLEVGCEQLPMLYTQRHLKDALHNKSPKNNHWHGLTKELIKEIPVLISEPAIIFDSISKEPKAQESIVCVLNKTDNENAPIIVSIKPNGKGIYELEQVDSNFITSIYGKDNGFGKYIERAAVSNQILFWDKQKSQELFSVLGLQLPQGLNNLDFNAIIHQSRNIVKGFEGNKEPTEEKPAPALKVPEQAEPEDKGSASFRKVGDFYEMYGKNAEIGAKVLGLRMLSKNGQPMVGFPYHIKDEYSTKLREAGYTVLTEQAFELNPPKREAERLTTLQDVVDKFFGTDCESAETDNGTWKLAIAGGDKLSELFYDGKAVCGIYSREDKMEIEPYRELSTFPKLLQTAMLEYNHNKPVEIMDFQRTFETPLDKAKYLINDFCEAEYRDEADFSDLHNISIAYTTLTDDELPIQVTADLVNFKIRYEFDGEVYNTEHYDSIEDMIENGLTGLNFSDLVSVPDEVIKRHTGKNEQTVELMSDAADVQGEQLSLFGDPEPIAQKKSEKPKSEFASGPVVDGVQVYEALAAEIDRGTGFIHGKLRVQDFYEEQHPTIQELADFLKKEYGTGGHSGEGKISLVDYNSQGITFNFENGEKYRHSWYNVATMTEARLRDDTYLSAEQKAERAALKAEKPDIPTVKNLSQLKKAIKPGMMFEITEHLRPECVGERRIVTGVTTVDFTSRKLDENGEPTGKDIHMEFDRAKNWSFDGGELTSRLDNGDMLMSFHLIESLEREQAVDTDRAFLSQVIEKFGEHYNEMYQNGDQVEGYTEAVAVGDQFIKENPDFMSRLAKQRNDVVSSDHETAALAFTLADVGLIEKITELEKKAEAEAPAPDKDENTQVVSIPEGVAHRNYIALTKMFPEFMNREYSYERLSAGEGFDPLSLEWIGKNSFSMMHYYIQNGDVMRDPDIVLTIDDERQAVKSFSYENSSLGAYREYENGSDEQRDCDKFVTNWLRNITAQGYEPVRAADFNDNEILFNDVEKQQSHSEKQPENAVNAEYNINSGLLGNGITVWNSAKIDKDTNDYETIAHIDTTNRLAYKFYVDDLPEKYKNEVFNIINNAEIQIDKTELVEKSALEFLDLKEHDDGYTVIKEYKYENGEFVLHDYSIKNEPSQLTQEDYDILANIKPRKSIMNFDSRDIHLTESWAKRYNGDKENPHNEFGEQLSFNWDFPTDNQSMEAAAIPFSVGDEIEYESRQYTVEKINESENRIDLLDKNTGWYPITNIQQLDTVIAYYNHYQSKGLVDIEASANKNADNFIATEATEKAQNFVIHDDKLGYGGMKEKYRMNVTAIKLLKELENSNRQADPEEQEILSRYVGWGGIPNAFDSNDNSWSDEYAELKELLTEDEYESANASVNNAHYTSPIIIRSMYAALDKFGFKGGRILEPACGVGNFIGSAPADKAANYDFTGIELDSISGRIAKQLYPQSNIQVCGFENSRVKDNYFDVAIGNVPFGNYTVTDRKYNKRNHLIHDYFILKSLDLVRPNGVVAVITSSGTMDKSNSKVRREISEKAELIGAIRLPNTAFKQNAGTETVTDILFLQKREIPSTERTSWINTNTTEYLDNSINQYFVDNPDMVCGNIKKISGRFGYKLTVEPFPDKTLEESLAECVSKLSGRIDFTTTQTTAADNTISDNWELHRNILISDPNMRNHTHTIVDDKIYYKKGGRLEEVDVRNFKAKEIDKLKDLIRLGTQARKTVDIQTQNPTMFDSERKELNILYDDFVKKYGFVHSLNGKVKEKWNNDDNNGITLSLEIPDPDDENNYVKNGIFYGRTINTLNEIGHCESVIDALSISLNVKAFVDISFIAQISEKPVEKCIKELNGTFIFRNPEKVREGDINSGWETADEYLSGNVLRKLKIAKAYSHANSDYEVNVSALENVQPERIKAGDISCQLGSSWIPTKYIESFAYECFDCSVTVEHNPITARWQISNKYIGDFKEKCTSTYGTSDWNALEIIEQSLNLKDCKVWRVEYINGEERRVVDIEKTEKAANKQDAVKDLFKSWIYKDVHRAEEIENIYNEKFNCEAPRSFNGSHLTFPGITNDIELKKHQKDAVARILYGGNTLLAHVVGAGKTFEMTAAAMELKRTGLMEKPLFVVPNNLVGQWQRDFQRLYPASNVLAVSNNDLKGNNRKEFSARIATGNYDAVIMPYSMFNRIEISPERRSDYYKDEIDECISVMDSEDKNSLSVKDAAIRKKKLEAQLEKLEYVQDRDSHVYFEELGIDGLFVDEAHNFKNLYINTKLSRIAGIGNSPSKQAEDLFLKCKYICEKNGSDKGIVFATGTPVSNSMTELYVMEKYLQPSYLKEKGYQHFDSWIADYGEISSAIELSPTGNSFRQKKRCRSFKNLPELMMGYRRCADIQTAEMLNLPIPKKKDDKYTLIITKPSEEQLEFIHECGIRADDVHNKNVSPDQDNMLKITNDGKMCALDMRLVDPQAEDNPNSKVNHCVRAVYAKYKETEQDGLSQVIFLDKSTPDPGKFNLYDDIRDKLVAMGIPREEIAFVHDAKNSTQKQKLFDDVNSGKVRIIIGSTEKMGAGTNMQEKLCALHHLDVPWRPSDIEQREGRILRQGNTCKEVEIFRYSTEKTFDSYSWQTIENKQKYISQVMTNKPMGRSIEDMDECALNYAEIKSLSTGDERIKQQLELSVDVAKLKSLKSQYESEMIEINKRLKIQYPQEIGKHNSLISDYEKDIELAKSNPKPDDEHFAVKINGTEFTNRKDAGKAVLALRGSVDSIGLDICKYRGFNISLENTGFTSDYGAAIYKLKIKNNSITLTSLGISHEGVFNGIDDVIDTTLNERLKKHKEKADEIKKNIAEAEARICEPFPHEEELKEKTEELNQLTLALKLNDNSDERNAGLSVNNDDNDNITTSRSR